MAGVEIKRKTRLSRKEAGGRLIALGATLVESSVSELDFDGDSIKFAVADHVAWEFELEGDDDEVEFEVELKWSHPGPAAPADTPKRAPGRRRSEDAG